MDNLRPLTDGEQIACMYRNYRGELSERRFQIREFWYGSTEWHPEPGLFLRAFDLDKQAERDFCVVDFDTSTLRIIEKEGD
ncbi:MAG: hypothetical protein MJH10_10135 [Epibacterium sp.]|nr:hypothetical protein [Epibacterium sp.]